MAKVSSNRPERPLVPSVLDRLIDDEPDVSREAPIPAHQVLRQVKAAVQRDLENLLNTRLRHLTWPAHLEELKQSLVSYGLPDWAGVSLSSSKEREDFARMLEGLIRRFEPRFQRISVVPVNNTEPLDRTFRFRIDALLRVDPAPEPIVFDSLVKPVTGDVEVRAG